MKTKKQIKELLTDLHPDTIGSKKGGNILLRWGFFYTHGLTAERYVEKVKTLLDKHQIQHHIVDSGKVWRPFRGGASVAAQSHFFVEVAIES